MKPDIYIPLVESAQQGDPAAFAELVAGYQDLVTGSAYGWLGNIESAREAAQESFLEAHLHLHQLRDPAAFPGWLRRIVNKQCDRVTRRPGAVSVSLDHQAEPASPEAEPARLAEAGEAGSRLRFAVEALPERERQVVSLHYFAEATGPELALFLELPLSTIKKRLRVARARLRHEGETLMQNTIDRLRPSKTHDLTREVSFFIALRADDCEAVARLLKEQPALVDAQQDWPVELVLDGLVPFANRATALITAIEQDNPAMLDLLLAAGADVNGRCGCLTGESPLWAATLLNRVELAEKLLAQGADPNTASSTGNYPLHLAAMRNHARLAGLLLAHGADPTLRDDGPKFPKPWSPADGQASAQTSGRTAAQWARANGHHELAALIETMPASGTARTVAGGGSLGATEPLVEEGLIRTGIKTLDLFAPIQRGGLIRLPFKAGVGMVVLLGELCQRFASAPEGAALWTGFTQPPFDLSDWEAEMAEFGLKDNVFHSLVSFAERPENRREAFQRGIEQAETLRDANLHVLAVVLCTDGFENDVEASLLRLSRQTGAGSITTIVVTPFPEKPEIWSTLEAPYTGQIVLDRARARCHLFPALHPSDSLSAALQTAGVGERHARLAGDARMLLASYERVDPEYALLEGEPDAASLDGLGMERSRLACAQRLLRYLSQPFHITEPFTGRSGEWVGIGQVLEEVDDILKGH